MYKHISKFVFSHQSHVFSSEARAKRKQEEEAGRKGEEEVRRRQAELIRNEQQEEARRRHEELTKRKQEVMAKRRQAEEAKNRQAEEAKHRQAEEVKRKQEEEAKRRQEEEVRRQQDEEARRKQAEEARRKQEEEARRKQEEEARRKQEEEVNRRAAEEAKCRQEEEANRKQEEEFKRQQEEVRIAASDIIAHLQHALLSSPAPIALFVEALSAVDAAVALYPSLCVDHPQVATLRADAHTRAATLAEDAVNAALTLANNTSNGNVGTNAAFLAALEAAIANAESVPFAPASQPFESLRSSIVNARRVAAYWSLRLRKNDHTQWTCDEVVTAFTAVAHMKDLASDSIAELIAYVKKERVDGSILSEVESDMLAQVSGQARRARVSQILKALCASFSVAVSVDFTSPSSAHAFSASHNPSASAPVLLAAKLGGAEVDDEKSDGAVHVPAPPPSASASASSADLTSSADIQNFAARLVDLDASLFEAGLSPITGIATAELLPFVDAVKRCGVKGLALNIKCAAKHGTTMKNHGAGGALTADHIAAIHMYTQDCAFYRTLNLCLRARDRTGVAPFFSYLRLLLEALRQLPAQKRTVYRGVKLDLSAKFRKGDEPVWWSVTSTSTTMEVLQSKEFCGQDGLRTVFVVQAVHARDIAAFSAFAYEEELILLPGSQLAVKAVVSMGGGLHLVQMDEIDEPMTLIEFEEEE